MQGLPEAATRGDALQAWAYDFLAGTLQTMTAMSRQLAALPAAASWDQHLQYARRLGVATRHVDVALHVLAYIRQDRTVLSPPFPQLAAPEAPLGAILARGLRLARGLVDVTLLRALDAVLADMLTDSPALTEGLS